MRLAGAACSVLVLVLVLASCGGATRVGVDTAVGPDDLAASRLVARVKTALLNDAVIGLRRIDVQATGADIRLTGRVATEAERDRALQIARGVEGVRNATSALEIRP